VVHESFFEASGPGSFQATPATSGSMTIDPRQYLFINVGLTVIMQRDPVGDWLRLDSQPRAGNRDQRE
jgi:hypothetical protein